MTKLYKNFAWIATWKITRRCNLFCVYCEHSSMRKANAAEVIDYDKAIKNIESYAPKVLNISGGEPTLVKNLSDIVSDIKQRWNPFIRIVHNGTDPEKFLPCLPFIDRLVVSLDGPDPINKLNRGLSADLVLSKLNYVLPEISRHKVEVFVNCVVTTQNLGFMRELAQKVYEVSPSIMVSFTPVTPPDGHLSILNDDMTFQKFITTFNDLKRDGFSVMHVFDSLIRHNNFKHIKCYNQYFIIRVSPEGQVFTCAMDSTLTQEHYAYYFRKLFSKTGFKKAFDRIKKKASQSVLKTPDFSCSTLCMCENWLDLVFLGIKSDGIASYAQCLRGRLSDDDYTNAQEFVTRYINPSFDSQILKNYVDKTIA